MTTENMHEFKVLAERRNFIAAAEALETTQASLSRHIMAMEEELGFKMLERNTRNVELTVYGLRFLHYAEKAVDILDAFDTTLSNAFLRKGE